MSALLLFKEDWLHKPQWACQPRQSHSQQGCARKHPPKALPSPHMQTIMCPGNTAQTILTGGFQCAHHFLARQFVRPNKMWHLEHGEHMAGAHDDTQQVAKQRNPDHVARVLDMLCCLNVLPCPRTHQHDVLRFPFKIGALLNATALNCRGKGIALILHP